MMARRIWRGTKDRSAPVQAPGGDAAHASSDGLNRADWPPAEPGADPGVPVWLHRAAGWAWRLLILGVLLYAAFRVASILRLVIVPCVAALLLTALLQPLTQRLRQL